ncbi:hypothetical protein, partial [Chromohalobacter moromii]
KLGSRLKRSQKDPKILDESFALIGRDWHPYLSKRPHELPDRLLKSGSGLDMTRAERLACARWAPRKEDVFYRKCRDCQGVSRGDNR